nr:HIT domain-containing protein [Streptomyces sp. Alain-F2R5]
MHPGHVFVQPRVHVEDAGTDWEVTAAVMRRAAELMAEHPAANLITSRGEAATQSVFHLHVHVVPRTGGRRPAPALDAAAHRPRHRRAERREPMSTVRLVMAREPIPAGPTVLLAGSTADRSAPVPSWRSEAKH